MFNVSLRDNILFGTDMDCVQYAAALCASKLRQDLKSLRQWGVTEIGQQGINLSSGQKQRASIANALHAQANLGGAPILLSRGRPPSPSKTPPSLLA